jgi:hypothetical protein
VGGFFFAMDYRGLEVGEAGSSEKAQDFGFAEA